MVYSQMYPGDVNFLDSVDTYLQKIGVPKGVSPQEKLVIADQARTSLYSYDVQCLPRIAQKILESDLETDREANALWIAFQHHVMDPLFVQFTMQFLNTRADVTINGQVGALFAKVVDKYIEEHWKKEDKDKKKDKTETKQTDFQEIKHIQVAIEELLGQTASSIQVACGNLTHPEALFIAACIAMNSKETIKEILRSDLAITADLFSNLRLANIGNLVTSALRFLKADVPTKPTANQSAFLESLKRWVYKMLDTVDGGSTVCYQYLVDVYGSVKPDVSPYYIQIKDCGTSYPNLLPVAKQIVNK
jgi:desulfoferrodoxin (superoxide reductase-like protein)